MKSVFTLLFFHFLIFQPLFSQSDWWEDIDLPRDTIFVTNCQDIEILKTAQSIWQIGSNWIFPNGIEDQNVVGSYKFEKAFDADSQCIGGVVSITLMNWLNFETYEYERVITFNPQLSGPCGGFYSFDERELEEGLLISDLDSIAIDISFFIDGSEDRLFLQANIGDTITVPIFQSDGPSVCFLKIEAIPPCPREFQIELIDDLSIHFGTHLCQKIFIEDVVLNAEYLCSAFDLGFLNAENLLEDYVYFIFDHKNPNKKEDLIITIRTEDGEEFSTTLEVSLTTDELFHQFYLYSDNPYLLEGEITYVGIGGDFEKILTLEGSLGLSGTKILEVQNIHPKLSVNEVLYYLIEEDFFFFLLYQPDQIFSTLEGVPWFVLKIQALKEGYLSELIDINRLQNSNGSTLLQLDSIDCGSRVVLNFPFIFSEDLLFSNLLDISEISHIQLFPNPAMDMLFIESDLTKIKEIKIFDLRGRLVLSKENLNTYLDVSQLGPGFYKLILTTNKGLTSGGFIKQ